MDGRLVGVLGIAEARSHMLEEDRRLITALLDGVITGYQPRRIVSDLGSRERATL